MGYQDEFDTYEDAEWALREQWEEKQNRATYDKYMADCLVDEMSRAIFDILEDEGVDYAAQRMTDRIIQLLKDEGVL